MTTHSIDPPRQTKTLIKRSTVIWVLFAIVLTFYASLVWEASYKLLPTNYNPAEAAMIDKVEELSNQGVPYSEVADLAQEAYPVWNNLTAMVTGTYFGFGSNGNSNPVRYYTSMEPVEKRALSLHMLLGGLLLVLGIFQFWPTFRRKYRKAHRAMGVVYILASFTMVSAAIYHLLHTGVENTYQGFAFHIELWIMAVTTLIAQVLSIVFLIKRNIPLHMGFQIYTYASFLTAPIQRYDWAVMGNYFSHLTQGEVNNAVNIMVLWQCILFGVAIFAWNRSTAPERSKPPAIVPSPLPLQVFLTALSVAAVITAIALYVFSSGLGDWAVGQAMIIQSTLAADAALYANTPVMTALFGFAIAAAIISGMWLMHRDENSQFARIVFYVSAFFMALQQFAWGYQLGEPKMAVTAGGAFYIITGFSLLLFTSLALFFQLRGNRNLWHEMMIFAINFAFAPVLMLWALGFWYLLGVIPEYYVGRGHGYVLAANLATMFPIMNGFIGMIMGRETQSRAVS